MIVLDTNVVSEVMRIRPDASVLTWLAEQTADRIYLTTVSVAEVGYGIATLPQGRRRERLSYQLESFLSQGFDQRLLEFDLPAARLYPAVKARRRALGRPISDLDGQIVAIARAYGFAVATRNTRDFEACGVDLINPFEDPAGRS